jgi:hypothetical protein
MLNQEAAARILVLWLPVSFVIAPVFLTLLLLWGWT